MSIRQKLLLISAVVILSMLGMAFLFKHTLSTLEEGHHIGQKIQHLEALLYQLRYQEQAFQLNHQISVQEEHSHIFQQLTQTLHQLKQQIHAYHLPLAPITSLQANLSEYQKAFHQLVEAQQRSGLDETQGLYGRLRASVHAVEAVLREESQAQLLVDVLMLRRHEKDFMLRRDMKYVHQFRQQMQRLQQSLARYALLSPTQLKQLEVALSTYQQDFIALVQQEQLIGLHPEQGLRMQLAQLSQKARTTGEQVRQSIEPPLQANLTYQKQLLWLLQGVIILSVAVVIPVLALLVQRRILHLRAALQAVAEGDGDLTRQVRLSGNDEVVTLGDVVNTFIEQLRLLITQLQASGSALNSTSATMHSVLEENEQTLQHQKTQLERFYQDLCQLAQLTKTIHQHVDEVAQLSQEGSSLTEQGLEDIQKTQAYIVSLVADMQTLNSRMHELEEATIEINALLARIQGIAEQTNLLALNASIEAARAGDQGRGFAVVADEVRQLATHSAQATEEVEAIVLRLRSAAELSSASTLQGKHRSEQGAQGMQLLTVHMQKLHRRMSHIAHMNSQIAQSTHQQQTLNESVDFQLHSLQHVIQRSRRSAEQLQDADHLLASAFQQLQTCIHRFKVDRQDD
ncbi:Methyl-accepting chemotaxis protein [Allopseudospirillum japonicum]|uniref:Methyl-accepting chemotaxis protein n=1 Tax=Allopseudospirillum japonicum TaxID=64971 RepID=A0A1H6U0J3_9GAMM|nr:methyl-accepting chemotaxis protein [Allopseudospirillum japonicum]SEI81955.1 Methyl-accepting chemotaxis protein [Allopseudospirillum japonicum]